jgi:O-Antigen ligase/Tetratricopeptide repeat
MVAPFPEPVHDSPRSKPTFTLVSTVKRPLPDKSFAFAVRSAPTAALCVASLLLAWREQGSIARGDWLPYAVLIPLVVATVLLFSDVTPAASLLLAAVVALVGLSLWSALSIAWSPVPALARDESVLVLLYASALVLPPLTLRWDEERLAAVGLVAATGGLLALVAAVHLARSASADDFISARLTFPVSYVNANAAVFLVGFWSAVSLAAHRALAVPLRVLASGASTAVLAAWLTTQSKGGGIALGASAIVVLALAPSRLRLLVPALVPALIVGAAYRPLTAPFRTQTDAALAEAGREAGRAMLLTLLVALAIGLVYALADRRVSLSASAQRRVERLAWVAFAAAAVVGAVVLAGRVDEPRGFVSDKWEAFKSTPAEESGSSHFVNLGSNRYDFWRVELQGFRDHPVAGIGGRGFVTEYRRERRSVEIPARGHSVLLDALLETGIVGFVLLVTAFGAILVGLARRAATVPGVAALGTFTYFGVHASGDWIWTFPAVGLLVFALAGAALSVDGRVRLPRPATLAAGAAALLAALVAVPAFLSDRITTDALERNDPSALDTARTFDPLAVEPWLAEHALARSPAEEIAALRGALERDPNSPSLHILLSETLREAGRPDEARAELAEARRLDPRGRQGP